MAENAIDRVRQAEQKAEETLREASAQAVKLADDRHTAAVEAAKKAEDAARAKAADTIAAAHKKSQKQLEEAAGALAGELEALRGEAAKRKPQAVEKILGQLA